MSLRPEPPALCPLVWSIAGSDNCSGAGHQADLKTLTALGVHGCTITTSLTAQNSCGVHAVEPVSLAILRAQFESLRNDLLPRAVKIGLLGDAVGIKFLASVLPTLECPVIYDPVLISSSGTELMSAEAVTSMRETLLPHIDVLTPNLSETEALTGLALKKDTDVEQAAQRLLALGVKAVVIKGWSSDADFIQDYFSDGQNQFWLTAPKQDGTARGTGCTFSSAIAAALAHTYSLTDAIVIAKATINQSLRLRQKLGHGMPFLTHTTWPVTPDDFPWLTPTAEAGRHRPVFLDCGSKKLGFYPVVDSLEWLQRLLPCGVTTAQLRIKNAEGAALEQTIQQAITLGRQYRCRLFINDYWQLAIKHGAYGVHLGQEDLVTADINAIAQAGLRLGLSTHCYAEVARAHALRPSYIAIGPIFPTTLKSMNFAPQGVAAFHQWRQMLDYSLVTIGGISLDTAPDLLAAGADSIAVVSDVTKHADPEGRTKAWLNLLTT